MQFNSHATNQDCVSEVLKTCGATTNTYPLVDITRRFNAALDEYFALAFKSDKGWPFDDANQTSAPLETQNIVSGTNNYKFSAFTSSVLTLNKLQIKNNSNEIVALTPETIESLENGFEETYTTNTTGTPTHYLKFGDFIYLRPTPNFSMTAGLRALVNRVPLYMASTDTTKVPGVPLIHHTYLCRKASLPFLIEKNLPQLTAVSAQILNDERAIMSYWGNRNEDMPRRITPAREDNR